jgi:hypothetical protein
MRRVIFRFVPSVITFTLTVVEIAKFPTSGNGTIGQQKAQ